MNNKRKELIKTMITRIIYDSTGFILSQIQASNLPVITGVPYLDVDVPSYKYVRSIDVTVTPNVAIFAELPKSDFQLLQEKVESLEIENANLKSKVEIMATDDLQTSSVVLDLLYLSDKGVIE